MGRFIGLLVAVLLVAGAFLVWTPRVEAAVLAWRLLTATGILALGIRIERLSATADPYRVDLTRNGIRWSEHGRRNRYG